MKIFDSVDPSRISHPYLRICTHFRIQMQKWVPVDSMQGARTAAHPYKMHGRAPVRASVANAGSAPFYASYHAPICATFSAPLYATIRATLNAPLYATICATFSAPLYATICATFRAPFYAPQQILSPPPSYNF